MIPQAVAFNRDHVPRSQDAPITNGARFQRCPRNPAVCFLRSWGVVLREASLMDLIEQLHGCMMPCANS